MARQSKRDATQNVKSRKRSKTSEQPTATAAIAAAVAASVAQLAVSDINRILKIVDEELEKVNQAEFEVATEYMEGYYFYMKWSDLQVPGI